MFAGVTVPTSSPDREYKFASAYFTDSVNAGDAGRFRMRTPLPGFCAATRTRRDIAIRPAASVRAGIPRLLVAWHG